MDAHILGINKLLKNESAIYNLGNGQGFSVLEMIQAARKVTGHPIPTKISPCRDGDIACSIASGKKAKTDLGWMPVYTDVEKIIETAWYYKLSLRKS